MTTARATDGARRDGGAPLRRALAAELLKLRTTRTTWALLISTVVLVALIVVAATAGGDWEEVDLASAGADLVSIAGIAQLFALVLGILAVTGELRHGTLTPSLLVVPNRIRLLWAKLAVNVAAGAALGAVTVGIALVLAASVFSLRGIDAQLGGAEAVRAALGTVAAVALYGALGVGVGAVARNQVGALVGALGYLFMVEPLLTLVPGLEEPIGDYGLMAVTTALGEGFGDPDAIGQLPAGLLLAGYAALFLAIGAILLRRRDVSG